MPKVYAVSLEEPLSMEQYDYLATAVSRDKLGEFRRFEDAQRSLVGRILVRYLICKELNIHNENLRFAVNRYGKPYLRYCRDLHFNISHAKNWVVCCIDCLPVGIDVEQVEPIDLDIAERFFSETEAQSIRMKSTIEQVEYFYELWTLKESYIKAIGKGLSIPLNSFTIKIDKDQITIQAPYQKEKFYFKLYELQDGYKLAICTKSNAFEDKIQFYSLNELYKKFLAIK